MRKSFIIVSCLLLVTGAMAQHMPFEKKLAGKLEKSRRTAKLLMSTPSSGTANRSTATYQRVKGLSEYGQEQPGGPVAFFDSIALAYSGMRGSEYNHNLMEYGNSDHVFSPMLPDNKRTFFPDNFNVYWPNASATYTFTYDVNDRVTEMYIENSGIPAERILYTYNNDKLVLVEYMGENGQNWDTAYRRYFVYDLNDMLTEDSLMVNSGGVWAIDQKYEYTYDVNGNIINLQQSNTNNMNGILQLYEEDHYTYNNNDQMTTATYAYFDEISTSMQLVFKDSFEYTTGFPFFTKDNYYAWDDANAVWITDGYMERALNIQMETTKLSTYVWNGSNYIQDVEERYTYNTEGNPIHDSVYLFNNGTIENEPVYLIHYYYEDYWDLHVNKSTAKAQVAVYPNPVTDVMTVTCSNNEAMQLQIVNALGQTVKRARSTGNAKLSIGDMVAGTYWLTVSDTRGNKLHTQMIVKQ